VLVAEADESDGSFAKYHPDIEIITNAEADHLDHYHTEENYHAAFADHVTHARRAVIMCVDDAGALAVLRSLAPEDARKVIAYSTHTADELGDLNGATFVHIASEHESANSGTENFVIDIPAALVGADVALPVSLRIPGLHNARNATAAILAAVLLGMDAERAAVAAGTFLGANRRFQIRGTVSDITVVDDYAHHPTEITALLKAARRRYPDSQLHVLFQPHLFSRTQFFAQEFADALSLADDVIVTGIFPAREKQSDFPQVTPNTIVDNAHGDGSYEIEAVDDMSLAAQMLAMRAQPGDVIFTVGAGDITRMGPVILHVLEAHYGNAQQD